MAKKKYAKFCPRCRSLDIAIDMQGGFVVLGVPAINVCRKCGFKGYVFPEVEIE